LSLARGLVLVTGANGAGKTNLLESLHVGTQGFSPRTRSDHRLVRSGATSAAIAVRGSRGGVATTVDVSLGTGTPRRIRLNGSQVRTSESLRHELQTLVFTPDRLSVVKGGPAVRRAYFDRALVRLYPARAEVPLEYASSVGQRNASLRRIASGESTREALEPWTAAVARLGEELHRARERLVADLSPGFSAHAERLGLPAASLDYEADPPTATALEQSLSRDLERGTTSVGPHLEDVLVSSDGRDLRAYGSQGEQRLAVLALLLAEAELLAQWRGTAPLLLLDDALSELDADRRRILSDLIGGDGQAVVTATGAEALPLAPAELLVVTPGAVRRA
jgi:DNA replication and repair protein RecF